MSEPRRLTAEQLERIQAYHSVMRWTAKLQIGQLLAHIAAQDAELETAAGHVGAMLLAFEPLYERRATSVLEGLVFSAKEKDFAARRWLESHEQRKA